MLLDHAKWYFIDRSLNDIFTYATHSRTTLSSTLIQILKITKEHCLQHNRFTGINAYQSYGAIAGVSFAGAVAG